MSRFSRIIMWILLWGALFVAIAYFLPKTVVVERSAEIQAPAKTVYAQIIDLHQWDHWSPWKRMNDDVSVEYKNNGVGVGSGYTLTSKTKKESGATIEITEAKPFDKIAVMLDFKERGEASSCFLLTENNMTTTVTWTLTYDVGNNPFARWIGLLMNKSMGTDFDNGLVKLKALCQVIDKENEYVILLDEVEEMNYAGVRETVPFIEVSREMSAMYNEISKFLAQKEIEMAGMPFALYHLMDEEEIDLECGIPIDEIVEGNRTVNVATFPTTTCACLDFYGDYNNLQEGHIALQKWMETHGLNLASAPMEIYLTDPQQEPDPANWITRICYPVER
ncbi:GyrI-like domain-containing protein [Draconibacterium sp. IB214405]|uniref:GyrI-like domain-containing protein n=1 Tax=Draconibacterium sp. IB214405 TaxID=3097352 RepID=UPI002A13456D|nr:GyrI-like domain-containing protein [Draconibacterium sp. IB214405]MDX8337577.1 GyrI-like domain-containing protein [Draconibacterium sp. IB214405]